MARQDRRQVVTHHQELHIGPLPQPETLDRFNGVLPGLAERIVAMAEANHRDRLWTNRTARVIAIWGPLLAFVLSMTIVVGGLWLIYLDKDVSGLTAIGAVLGTLLAAFMKARSSK